MVSFIGCTGAGKSTLIRMLLERPWNTTGLDYNPPNIEAPVVGGPGRVSPESGDIHLYLEVHSSGRHPTTPLLLADCEGLDGGDTPPRGACDPQRSANTQGFSPATAVARIKSYVYDLMRSREVNLPDTAEGSSTPSRGNAVSQLFPRLLYNYSNTIVFVLGGNAAQQMEINLVKVLNWSQASASSAVNRASLPHLIIALNSAAEGSIWDPEEATKKIFEEQKRALDANSEMQRHKKRFEDAGIEIKDLNHLLRMSYSSVTFIWIPKPGLEVSHNQLTDQLQHLSRIIEKTTHQSRRQMRRKGMILPSEDQELFFQCALDHYANRLDQPFNFLEKLLELQPMPNTLENNFASFLESVVSTIGDSQVPGEDFLTKVAPVLASAIALDATRFLHKFPQNLPTIFSGRLEEDRAEEVSPHTNNDVKAYERHLKGGVSKFLDQQRCEYQDDDQNRCINTRRTHAQEHHQRADGQVFGNGGFQSNFVSTVEAEWRNRIVNELKLANEQISDTNGHLPILHDLRPRARAAWNLQHGNLQKLFQGLPEAAQHAQTRFVCFWCLKGIPVAVLPCRHSICAHCARCLHTEQSQVSQAPLRVVKCSLHQEPKPITPPALIQTKPALAGVRILTLDGGGVRGVIELGLLQEIQTYLGTVPVQRFFDLIGGTSTGGLITLGLCEDWSLEACQEKYRSMCERAFTSPWTKHIACMVWGCRYKTEALERVLKEQYGERSMMDAGSQECGTNNIPHHFNRIFITSTKNTGRRACIFTNYTRAISEKSDDYSYEMHQVGMETGEGQIQYRLWHAARATSAAPTYFAPLSLGGNAERLQYWDGGILNNNPARIAREEAKKLWPDVTADHPDILLSIGSGFTQSRDEIPPDEGHFEMPASFWSRIGCMVWDSSLVRTIKILKTRMMETMDSEKIWNELTIMERRPGLDDVDALKNGTLNSIVAEYVLQNREAIKETADRLIATSFYFQPEDMPRHDEQDTIHVKGWIFCRFYDNSQDLDAFLQLLLSFHGVLRFRLRSAMSEAEWHINPTSLRTMQETGKFRIPNVQFSIPSGQKTFDISLATDKMADSPISGCPCRIRSDTSNLLDERFTSLIL